MDYSKNPMPPITWLQVDNRKILPSWKQIYEQYQERRAIIVLVSGSRSTITGNLSSDGHIERFEIAPEPKPYSLK